MYKCINVQMYKCIKYLTLPPYFPQNPYVPPENFKFYERTSSSTKEPLSSTKEPLSIMTYPKNQVLPYSKPIAKYVRQAVQDGVSIKDIMATVAK